jgi:flagellin-specific chaperone FliS
MKRPKKRRNKKTMNDKEKAIDLLERIISRLESELSHVQNDRIIYDDIEELKDYINEVINEENEA